MRLPSSRPPPRIPAFLRSGPRGVRRYLLLGTAILLAIAIGVTLLVATRGSAPRAGPTNTGESGNGPPFLPYSASSFFRTPLTDSAPLDPESDAGIAFIKRTDRSAYPVIRGVEGDRWGTPFAIGTCDDPLWTLEGSVPREVSFLTSEGFHAPRSLADSLTLTSDSPLVVMDRCGTHSMPHGLTVWAAKVSSAGDEKLEVGAAGAFQHDSNGLDFRDPESDSDLNYRSRGAIPDAMVIRDDLLRWGVAHDGDLGHVLHMFWEETDSSAGAVHPMVGAESGKHGFGAEGMRIRIKPGVDLAGRHCTAAGLVVARTLQRYGAYLGDNSGGASSLKAQQDSRLITRDALSCLTWDDFEFVQRRWDASVS